MERLKAARTLYTQLAVSAALLLFALFAIQLVVGAYTLQLMQDRSKQQLLRPFVAEIAELIEQQQREHSSFAALQERLFQRFHGISELGIFVFTSDGHLLNDLSFSGVSTDLRVTAARLNPTKMSNAILQYIDNGSQPLFPTYIDDPQSPERRVPFAAAPLSALPGFVVVTPGGELGRVLSSISWDATGVAAAVATLLLSISGAVLLGFLLFRRTASRFSELSRIIKKLASGELHERATLSDTRDELGDLLSSINQLGEALHRRQQERQLILSAVAHDLHSPIAVITGHSERLLSDNHPSLSSVASSIRNSAHAASVMISELLELAVLDAQAQKQNIRQFDIADLLDEMVFGLQGRAEQSGVRLSAQLPERDALTSADPLQIERVLSNLVRNANRHTPKDGNVVIGVVPHLATLEVFVRDSGEGIPADQLDSIVAPYSQGEHRAQRTKGLAGLGLTICREILARHGSALTIDSAVGKGTTCSFTLPRIAKAQ